MTVSFNKFRYHGSNGETLRPHSFTVFWIVGQDLGNPLAHSLWYWSVSLTMVQKADLKFHKITQHRNCEPTISLNCLIHLLNKIIVWSSLNTCILNVCMCCFKIPASLPHVGLIHESFTIHITCHQWMLTALHPSAWRNQITTCISHLAGNSLILSMLTCLLCSELISATWQDQQVY